MCQTKCHAFVVMAERQFHTHTHTHTHTH